MAGSNHKDFDNKKDALAFLKKNALMSVGWPEGKEQKVAIYWNGRLHIEKSTTKKIWGAMNRQKIAQELVAVARELTGGMMKRWLEDISVEMGLDGEITKAVMKEAEKRMKKLNVKKGSREMTAAKKSASIGVRDAQAIVAKANGRIDLVLRALQAVVWDQAYENEDVSKKATRVLQEAENKIKALLY